MATSPDVTVGRKCTTLTRAKDPGLLLVRTPRGEGKIRFQAQPDRRDRVLGLWGMSGADDHERRRGPHRYFSRVDQEQQDKGPENASLRGMIE
jgi:hypothetical protein